MHREFFGGGIYQGIESEEKHYMSGKLQELFDKLLTVRLAPTPNVENSPSQPIKH